jgi:hypothetical protein
MFLFAVVSVIVWVGLLLLSRSRLRVERRTVASWIATGGLLLASQQLLVQVASRQHWTLHHTVLGVVGFVLPVAGLVCFAVAAFSLWRRKAFSVSRRSASRHQA